MSYFNAVRLYSALELCVFIALLVTAISGASESAEAALGWTHGVGWILLCLAVAEGCRRKVFPWITFAATVSPAGPLGCTLAIEWQSRRRVA